MGFVDVFVVRKGFRAAIGEPVAVGSGGGGGGAEPLLGNLGILFVVALRNLLSLGLEGSPFAKRPPSPAGPEPPPNDGFDVL